MSNNYFFFWLPMIAIAFANALLRESVIVKYYSEFRAQQLSTITLIVLCILYLWLIFPRLHLHTSKQALMVGFIWVLLTVAFELILGRLTNKSWEYLFRNYDILSGRLWLLFLGCLFISPYLFWLIKKQ